MFAVSYQQVIEPMPKSQFGKTFEISFRPMEFIVSSGPRPGAPVFVG